MIDTGRSKKGNPMQAQASAYKPTMHIDGSQIPKGIAQAEPGAKVTLQVHGKLKRKSDGIDPYDRSMTVEIHKLEHVPKGPAAAKAYAAGEKVEHAAMKRGAPERKAEKAAAAALKGGGKATAKPAQASKPAQAAKAGGKAGPDAFQKGWQRGRNS